MNHPYTNFGRPQNDGQKRDAFKSEWRKMDRKIFRHGTVEAYADAGITCLPGDPEIAVQAQHNLELANHFGYLAEQIIANNARKAAQFVIAQPRKVRVTITVEE